MTTRRRKLSNDEIRGGFAGPHGDMVSPILSPRQLADLLNLGVKTIYQWLKNGRLDGAFRKRGKHVLIWRDRAVEILFNGPDWKPKE
ncbi:MAG: helix-turn-helix domain-containing protein [Planctomycetota bacterium]